MSEKELTEQTALEKKGGEFYFLGLLFVLMGFTFKNSLEHPGIFPYQAAGPGFFPQLMSGFILILCVLLVFELLRDNYKEQKFSDVMKFLFSFEVIAALILITLYAVFLEILHFELDTLLFLIAAMIVLDRKEYLKKVIVSVGTLVFIIVIFNTIFQVILP